MLPQVKPAKVVLELACGPGVLARAYLVRFPGGIPGLTVIFTDCSQSMVDVSEQYVKLLAAADCQTTFKFRLEDAAQIESLADNEVDVVLSSFAVYMAHPREAVFSEIWRVLRKGDTSGNASWTKTTRTCVLKLLRCATSKRKYRHCGYPKVEDS